MAPDTTLKRRTEALVEVVHAVLHSTGGDAAASRDRVLEAWDRVIAQVDRRLGLAATRSSEAGRATKASPLPGGPGSAPAEPQQPARERKAPRPSRGDSESDASLFDFLRPAPEGEGKTAGIGAEPRSAPAGSPDTRPLPEEFFDRETEPEDVLPGGAASPPAESAPLELEGLRKKVQALERQVEELRRDKQRAEAENAELRREAARAGAGPRPGGGIPLERYLEAFGIESVPGRKEDASERVSEHLRHFAVYFEKTRGNLQYLFSSKGFNIPVVIPAANAAVQEDLEKGKGFDTYLELLRDCWKVIIREVWLNVGPWCKTVETSLDPADILEESRTRKEAPWETYKDRFQRMSLESSLRETLRAKIRDRIRQLLPERAE